MDSWCEVGVVEVGRGSRMGSTREGRGGSTSV